jgi:hypothetical protein
MLQTLSLTLVQIRAQGEADLCWFDRARVSQVTLDRYPWLQPNQRLHLEESPSAQAEVWLHPVTLSSEPETQPSREALRFKSERQALGQVARLQ